MPSARASFYARDTERFILNVTQPEEKKYVGIERRMESRRKRRDRRVDIRFNLTKADRRQSEGRRKEDKLPEFW